MKKLQIYLLGLLVLATTFAPRAASAQDFWERFMPRVGGAMEVVGIRYPNGTTFFSNTPSVNFFSIAGGGYYAYAHSNDMFSVGIDPNLHLSVRFSSPVSMLLQVPVFLTGRIGMGSTRYNESNFGFGLGIGVNVTYARIVSQDILSGHVNVLETAYPAPALMADVSFMLNNPVTVRFQTNLTPQRRTVETSLGVNQELDFSNWSIGIFYSFY